MKLKIPEIKIPEVKLPKVKLPKGGIPKVNIPNLRRKDAHDEPAADETFESFDDEAVMDDIPDEFEDTDAAEIETEPAPKPQEKVKSYGMVISEDQLRLVWAGEIGFSLLIVFASVLIAIAS